MLCTEAYCLEAGSRHRYFLFIPTDLLSSDADDLHSSMVSSAAVDDDDDDET